MIISMTLVDHDLTPDNWCIALQALMDNPSDKKDKNMNTHPTIILILIIC